MKTINRPDRSIVIREDCCHTRFDWTHNSGNDDSKIMLWQPLLFCHSSYMSVILWSKSSPLRFTFCCLPDYKCHLPLTTVPCTFLSSCGSRLSRNEKSHLSVTEISSTVRQVLNESQMSWIYGFPPIYCTPWWANFGNTNSKNNNNDSTKNVHKWSQFVRALITYTWSGEGGQKVW